MAAVVSLSDTFYLLGHRDSKGQWHQPFALSVFLPCLHKVTLKSLEKTTDKGELWPKTRVSTTASKQNFVSKKRNVPRRLLLLLIKSVVPVKDSYSYLHNHTCECNYLQRTSFSLEWWCAFWCANCACYWVPSGTWCHLLCEEEWLRTEGMLGLLLSILQDLC